MIEDPVALKEAETAWVVVGEGRNHDYGGDCSGRHSRSPLPDHIARPSEIMDLGARVDRGLFLVSENQYIEVSGAMPKRETWAP